jgi:hypothetical protein
MTKCFRYKICLIVTKFDVTRKPSFYGLMAKFLLLMTFFTISIKKLKCSLLLLVSFSLKCRTKKMDLFHIAVGVVVGEVN